MTDYIFKLSEQDVQILVAALNELPRKHSEPLIQKMQAQINEQIKPKTAAPKPGRKKA